MQSESRVHGSPQVEELQVKEEETESLR